MKTFTKALVGTVAAGAMAISSAAPAFARDGRHNDRHDDRIDTGEVIAGALVIGGIAAIAASAGDRDNGYDRAGYRDGNGRGWRGGNPRGAVERCVVVAEREASRYGYGRADVTDVSDVRQTRYGYEVRGRIAVNTMGRGWHRGDGNYGRGWNDDYRGWNGSMRGYDSGSFTCRVDGGRVADIDFNGLRGLR